jgi:Domain of unknown function (DUF4249)
MKSNIFQRKNTASHKLHASCFSLQLAACSRNLYNLAFFLFVASTILSSCEDVINVKLSKEDLNLFGVEARITTLDGPTVFLYQTLKVDQDISYPGISGAEVTVSDDARPVNKIRLAEDPAKPGLYSVPKNSNYFGVTGREYTLSILSSGVTLTAKDKLSKVEPIDSIVVKPSMRGNKIFLAIFTYGREPAGLGNFYKWDVFVNDTLLNKADRISIASDEFVDGNYIPGLEVYTDFHDQKKPKDRKLNLNDTIVVKQNSISEFGYNFYFQMINQSSTGSLFSIPPANVKSNFTSSDGRPVLGLFAAEDVSVSNIVVINQAIEDQLTK